MSTSSHNVSLQAKLYNEAFAFKSSLWKLQHWLNQCQHRSASPSPSSVSSKTSKSSKDKERLSSTSLLALTKRKQENENNFRSIIEELQTMLSSHKRKYGIKRVQKKPTKQYALSRELRNIGENLNLSIDDENTATTTKIAFGSKHQLSQFLIEIAFQNDTCDVVLDECCVDITLCNKPQTSVPEKSEMDTDGDGDDDDDDDKFVDVEFAEQDTNSMLLDIKQMIDSGNFERLGQKLLLMRYFDDFHNYFPALLLKELVVAGGDGTGSIHKDIELCLRSLPNISEYKRLLDGPSVVYGYQIMDFMLSKIKPPRVWRLSFIGMYPAKCMIMDVESKLGYVNSTVHRPSVHIVPIRKNEENKMDEDGKDNEQDNNNNNSGNVRSEQLCYWFKLWPSVIVPVEVAKKIFGQCVGRIVEQKRKEQTNRNIDQEAEKTELASLEDDKRSSHSSWIIDQTYSYHNMLIGDLDFKHRKPIEIFENEHQFFKFKADQMVNGVKIDHFAIYDLNYIDVEHMEETTLFHIINELKNWVILNQLYSQCFDYNYKKWKIKRSEFYPQHLQQLVARKITNKFEICIRNSNHLELRHIATNIKNASKNADTEEKKMELDGDDAENADAIILNDAEYEQFRQTYKLPPKVNEWIANFYIDNKHNISVTVNYWLFNATKSDNDAATKTDEKPKALELDSVYHQKINKVLQQSNSVPITLSYVSQLFDGRYLSHKLKRERLQRLQQQQQLQQQQDEQMLMDEHNDNTMIDID